MHARRALYRCRVLLERSYTLAREYARPLVTLNQKRFGFWHYELALMCTYCGHDRFPAGRRGLARLSKFSNLAARYLPRPRRPTRILMLFEKD